MGPGLRRDLTWLHVVVMPGGFGWGKDRVPGVGRNPPVSGRVADHVDRVEPLFDALDLLAQHAPQHHDAAIRMAEVFQRMHRDRALAFLRLKIVRLSLPLLIAALEERSGADFVDRIGPRLPAALRLAVFERPGDDADPADMLVVDRDRPGQFGGARFALRRGARAAGLPGAEG